MHWVIKKDTEAVLENTRLMKEYGHSMDIFADECAVSRKNKAERPQEPDHPTLREFWVSRGTTEGVTRLLQHSPKVTWYMDEASGMINGWDRYAAAGKGSGDREFVLMLWNGGPGKNTLAGKTVSLPNASAVLCGGSTPSAMLQCAGGKLKEDGFLQRTFLCMTPKKAHGADAIPNEEAYGNYESILNNLLNMPGDAIVKLSASAQGLYNDFDNRLNLLIDHEENKAMAGHMGKWFGVAPRLMLIYHMIEKARHGQYVTDNDRISDKIAENVCKLLMEWQKSHLQEFWYELMSDKSGRGFSPSFACYLSSGLKKSIGRNQNGDDLE